jgi:poly-gamma-glutamate capsule biosynthesis protein CapA/YwtB (metallophosphatase superfamily)
MLLSAILLICLSGISVEAQVKPKSTAKDTVTLVAVGDIMLGTNYPNTSYLPPAGQENLLLPAEDLLRSADITFGNLEGTILNSGGNPKQCGSSACYLFRMNESSADLLKDAGFDLLSIANNHAGDFGEPGRLNTMRVLKEKGLECAGQIVKPTCVIERNGLKIGLAGFAPNTGTVDINDDARIKEIIDSLRPHCDILIVSFHGGAEGKSRQHIARKHEIFYGEDRGDVYHFAHLAIDAGADVVLGHGPHVARAADTYKGKFIIYSLGNFCTYSRFNLDGETSYAPALKLYIDRKGNFLKAEIHSYEQLGEGGPTVDAENKAYLKIKELTQQDIPEASFKFVSPNLILPK